MCLTHRQSPKSRWPYSNLRNNECKSPFNFQWRCSQIRRVQTNRSDSIEMAANLRSKRRQPNIISIIPKASQWLFNSWLRTDSWLLVTAYFSISCKKYFIAWQREGRYSIGVHRAAGLLCRDPSVRFDQVTKCTCFWSIVFMGIYQID